MSWEAYIILNIQAEICLLVQRFIYNFATDSSRTKKQFSKQQLFVNVLQNILQKEVLKLKDTLKAYFC